MALSKMMLQYQEIKKQHPDTILFYRLGDFYEMFFEDALVASEILDITLTGRDCGLETRAPMCGVPFHSAQSYVSKLVAAGKKVGICEQTSLPEKGKIVDREVVKIITAGTLSAELATSDEKNNFIAAISVDEKSFAIAFCDVTTGEFSCETIKAEDRIKISSTLAKLNPSEIVCTSNSQNEIISILETVPTLHLQPSLAQVETMIEMKQRIQTQFGSRETKTFFDSNIIPATIAVSSLLQYLLHTQKNSLAHVNTLSMIDEHKLLVIDQSTIRNLELFETMLEKKKKGSLIDILDKTKTSMGARKLARWVSSPLFDEEEIIERQMAIEDVLSKSSLREELRALLSKITDIERICGKISLGSILPRDCLLLAESLKLGPELEQLLHRTTAGKFMLLGSEITTYTSLVDSITNSIDPSFTGNIKDGGFVRAGFKPEIDELKKLASGGIEHLGRLEAKERERTGIKNLKIGYNRVFGYFFEVNKSQTHLVPLDFIRKQTISNNERYVNVELKNLEEKVITSQEELLKMELAIYDSLKAFLQRHIKRIQSFAHIVSEIDVLTALAHVAITNNYCKPKIEKSVKKLEIIDGRHPVVEKILKDELFISNNTLLDKTANKTIVLTGPNMAGKSTYMRQVALIVLMAHIGSFVPAKKATIPLTDKIFTRVGASDDLSQGQSTFMVEMLEVAQILKYATANSFLILDEIGRGTATTDGLSIAWAVMEEVTVGINAKTIFSTHFHELSDLEGMIPGIKNHHMAVKEINNQIVFLRKIQPGPANRSFGLHVAELAGVPKKVLENAKTIMEKIEEADEKTILPTIVSSKKYAAAPSTKKLLELQRMLVNLNINKVSPMIAFDILNELVQKAKAAEPKGGEK